ncbi:peptidase inhibitor family I36 protein [Prosthecobacter sp.]|uniref:peptidase inhibitor family I36 protein n=1 Tax=Prosthecobacter sp. TaxID=1965333 RepID=UPI003783D8AB
MKSYYTAVLALVGITLTSCAHHLPSTSPGYYNPNCYVNIYEHSGFRGEVVQLQGPSTYSSLKGLKGRDWDNTIGSLQTGPGCWVVLYKDKDYKDQSMVIGPNTSASSLGNMDDQAESIKVLDHP